MDDSVKVEQQGETVKRYLDGFSEELEQNEEADESEAPKEDDNDLGTYFIDEDGQIYFQPHVPENSLAVEEEEEEQEQLPTVVENKEQEESEEVSYVYIVEEGEEENKDKEENDITVYDFNEDNDENAPEPQKEPVSVVAKKIAPSKELHYCPHCDYSNVKRTAVHKHMKSHTLKKPYKCSVCAKEFRSCVGLTNHENTHTGTKPFRCRVCDAKFTTSGEIIRHVRYRHTNLRPHKCNECDYAAVELSKLRRHQRSHTGERPYQCPHCTYASPDTFKLKRHLRVHTGERPYKCDICYVAFTQSNSLKAHRLTHFPENRPMFHCALCPVTCSRKADLRAHIRKLHTANKLYECKRCGKHLPDKYSYNVHTKSHTGEKSHKCEFCTYASISKLHLESHMFIHTNEKPYECDECDYRSRQRQLLKRHKNIYHNPEYVPPEPNVASHECDVCHKKFIHVGNLIKHLAVHDPDSQVHEEKEALRAGRKRRINVKEEDDDMMPGSFKEVEDGEDEGQYIVFEIDGVEDDSGKRNVDAGNKAIDVDVDMKNCFGFDDGSEEDE